MKLQIVNKNVSQPTFKDGDSCLQFASLFTNWHSIDILTDYYHNCTQNKL